MTGLPSRFAKMGFAKGWKAFRSTKINRAPARIKRKMVKTMARRKHYFGKRRHSRGSSSGGMNLTTALITGAAYGIIRPQIESMVQQNLPRFANGYEDEIVVGGLAALGSWKGGGKIKQVSNIVLAMEAARLASGMSRPTGQQQMMIGQTGPL